MAEERSPVGRAALLAGRVVLAAGRVVGAAVPRPLRKAVADRFFYAVFNVTRVTNDHYGWRPDEPGGEPGDPDEDARARKRGRRRGDGQRDGG